MNELPVLAKESPLYQQIHNIIRLIPAGKVATYGQIAEIVGGCTARMVGYAASSIPLDSDIPWQRVINYKGGVSQRSSGPGGLLQQKLLEAEGIEFDQFGRTDLERYRWQGE
ncbi:MAG: DNA base-flipping protein [Deltaproteobacteria bacterium]|nr:DNA base-flipping protein [Deltaproteobacteria bacterium]